MNSVTMKLIPHNWVMVTEENENVLSKEQHENNVIMKTRRWVQEECYYVTVLVIPTGSNDEHQTVL